MTRKKFIKQLMAAGVSRNTAAEAATVTAWQGKALDKTLGHLLTIRGFMAFNGSKHLVADFEREILRAARSAKSAPAPMQLLRFLAGRPSALAVARKNTPGFLPMLYAIDHSIDDQAPDRAMWTKENPAAEFLQKKLHIPQQGGATT